MPLRPRHDPRSAAAAPRRPVAMNVLRAALLASVALGLPACATDTHLGPSAKAAAGPSGSAAETLIRVARGTRDNGDLASSVTIYKRAHEMARERADILVELGQVLSALGAHNEAADVFREAARLEPDNTEALRGLGNSLLVMNQPALALEQFVAALAVKEDPRVYNGMGVVHDVNGSHDSAQSSYRSGLQLAPTDMSLRNNLAISLGLAGKFDESIQILLPLVKERGATTRHRQNLAMIYGLAGRYADAASIARLEFDEPTVQNNLAYYETLRAMPGKDRAKAVFGISIDAAPVLPTAAAAPAAPARATPAATAAF